MEGYLPVLAVIVLVLIAYGTTRRRDGRTPPVFDCGRDDCTFRGKTKHRHWPGTPPGRL